MPALRLNTLTATLLACLLQALLLSCRGEDTPSRLPSELLERRAEYDTSRPWSELVRPHFFALDDEGKRSEIEGEPDRIVVRDGVVKVRLSSAGGGRRYVDLLALESERLGEHPVHKVFRLDAMGVAIQDGLAKSLSPSNFDDGLFRTLNFDYLRGQRASGVITELFPDGTFLVIPYGAQSEWQSEDDTILPPSHFHAGPRALSAGGSTLARQYEDEILALSFNDQRYPPVDVARRQYGVFSEARAAAEYTAVLESVGYAFTPSHVDENDDAGFGARATRLLRRGSGNGVSYFGFEARWSAGRLADLGADWLGECDAVYGIRPVSASGTDAGYHATHRRPLEPDKTQRYKIVRVSDDGRAEVLHSPPGIVMLAIPLPSDPDRWILSSEGWPSESDGGSADPRFQSVYLADVASPDAYEIVRYPISRYQGGARGTIRVLRPAERRLSVPDQQLVRVRRRGRRTLDRRPGRRRLPRQRRRVRADSPVGPRAELVHPGSRGPESGRAGLGLPDCQGGRLRLCDDRESTSDRRRRAGRASRVAAQAGADGRLEPRALRGPTTGRNPVPGRRADSLQL